MKSIFAAAIVAALCLASSAKACPPVAVSAAGVQVQAACPAVAVQSFGVQSYGVQAFAAPVLVQSHAVAVQAHAVAVPVAVVVQQNHHRRRGPVARFFGR